MWEDAAPVIKPCSVLDGDGDGGRHADGARDGDVDGDGDHGGDGDGDGDKDGDRDGDGDRGGEGYVFNMGCLLVEWPVMAWPGLVTAWSDPRGLILLY